MGRQRCPLRCCFQPRSQACCCSIFTLRPYPTPHALTQSCPHKPPFPLLITKARINLVTGQEGESCLRTFDCGPGLCCARHFWTKICKPVPLEGQVCSRRAHKDTAQAPEIFQRCDCGPGLSRRSQATGNQRNSGLRVWPENLNSCTSSSRSLRQELKNLPIQITLKIKSCSKWNRLSWRNCLVMNGN